MTHISLKKQNENQMYIENMRSTKRIIRFWAIGLNVMLSLTLIHTFVIFILIKSNQINAEKKNEFTSQKYSHLNTTTLAYQLKRATIESLFIQLHVLVVLFEPFRIYYIKNHVDE